MEHIDEYNKKFNTNLNKSTIRTLLNNKQKPDWINVYKKVILLPIIADTNEITEKMNKGKISYASALKDMEIDGFNVSINTIDEKALNMKKVLVAFKKEYLKKYFDEYLKKTEDTISFKNLDDYLEKHSDFKESEKFLRLQTFIKQINKINEVLRTKYKKETKDILYSDFKDITDLTNAEFVLNNTLTQLQKVKEEEEKKEKETNDRNRIIRGKLNQLNRIRARIGLNEYNMDRYKDMSIQEASKMLDDDISDATKREDDKNRASAPQISGGSGVPMRLTGPTMSTGSSLLPQKTINPLLSTPSTTTPSVPSKDSDDDDDDKPSNSSVQFKPVNSAFSNYKGGVINLVEKTEKGLSLRSLWLKRQKEGGAAPPPLMPRTDGNQPFPVRTFTGPGEKPIITTPANGQPPPPPPEKKDDISDDSDKDEPDDDESEDDDFDDESEDEPPKKKPVKKTTLKKAPQKKKIEEKLKQALLAHTQEFIQVSWKILNH